MTGPLLMVIVSNKYWSHKDQTRVDAERRKKPFKRMAFYYNLLLFNCLIIPKISFTLKKYFSAFVNGIF